MAPDKKTEPGEVDEPQELAAEDAVGAAETPTERQQEREQAIVDEPVAESEQRIAEATEATTEGSPSRDEGDGEEGAEEAPRVKPEIPGMDLEPDLIASAPADSSSGWPRRRSPRERSGRGGEGSGAGVAST